MRKLLFLFVFILAACGGDGQRTEAVVTPPAADTRHTPNILDLQLSLSAASYMDGGGSVAVTALIEAADPGLDVKTVFIRMSDGSRLTFDVAGQLDESQGTITTPEFDVATTEVGLLHLYVGLADEAGYTSGSRTEEFLVKGDPYTWMERAIGLPVVLNDVATGWGDSAFVAVGDEGTIMTSADGLTWTNEVSGTSVDLHFVECLSYWGGALGVTRCYAAGDNGTVLVNYGFDNGWTTEFDGPDDVSMHVYDHALFDDGFAVGTNVTTDVACILRIDDEGWTAVEPLSQGGHHITDLAVSRTLVDDGDPIWEHDFVATVSTPLAEQAKVVVSHDFVTWVEVFVSDDPGSTYSILDHDDYWVGGSGGKMFSSADGVNWTQYQTPATSSDLVAMTMADGMLMAHGYSETIGLGPQVGVATSDGGATWQSFVIGAAYEPRGVAYGNGRWVSVGQSLAEPGRGAIFTTQ